MTDWQQRSYFDDEADNDSPFCEAFRYISESGERAEDHYSITSLDEFLMITGNILSRPRYVHDSQVKAWADELQSAINRATR